MAYEDSEPISAARKILFSALLLTGFFVCLELVLRVVTTGSLYLFESNPHILDAHGSYGLKPETASWWYGMRYEVNTNGFRMSRDVGPKRGIRIVAIGDSVTEGIGVRHSDQTWPFQLERAAISQGFKDVESINTGIQGWDLLRLSPSGLVSGEFRRFLEQTAPALEPDIVVYVICLNDTPSSVHAAFAQDNSRNRRRFAFFPEASREWFKRKAIYRLFRDSYREARFHGLDFSAAPAPEESEDLWTRVSAEIATLKGLAEAMDAGFYAVIVPYSYQLLPRNVNLLELNQRWHEALSTNGVSYSDLSDRLAAENVLDHFALGDYIHLNEQGHSLVAEEVLTLIRGELESRIAAGPMADHTMAPRRP